MDFSVNQKEGSRKHFAWVKTLGKIDTNLGNLMALKTTNIGIK